MTREETIRLIGVITAAYPNFDRFRNEKHIRSMVDVWSDMFSDDEAGLVALAVKEHISTSKWPPSIAEIRALMAEIACPDIIAPYEAWESVVKYIHIAGEYGHDACRCELPGIIAQVIDAVGYDQLYALHVAHLRGEPEKAGLSRVAFLQAYSDKAERQKKRAMLPGALRKKIKDVAEARGDGGRRRLEGINQKYEEYEKARERLAFGLGDIAKSLRESKPVNTLVFGGGSSSGGGNASCGGGNDEG